MLGRVLDKPRSVDGFNRGSWLSLGWFGSRLAEAV
jgi:hypothetical protein